MQKDVEEGQQEENAEIGRGEFLPSAREGHGVWFERILHYLPVWRGEWFEGYQLSDISDQEARIRKAKREKRNSKNETRRGDGATIPPLRAAKKAALRSG
jgi:hypothetical protein